MTADLEFLAALVAAGVSLLVGVAGLLLGVSAQNRTASLQREIADKQAASELKLTAIKAQLDQEGAEEAALRTYRREGLKRLYEQCEPLMFQAYELADAARYRVVSLARSARQGRLDVGQNRWLADRESYYLVSTIHRLLGPLAIFRLLQQRLTAVDLGLDPRLGQEREILKLACVTMTDDYVLAGTSGSSSLADYDPHHPDWARLRLADPARHWRQGVPMGRLDSLLDAMIVGSGSGARVMNHGEFEAALHEAGSVIQRRADYLQDLLFDFHPQRRPVLWRVLITQVTLYQALYRIRAGRQGGDIPSRPLRPLSPQEKAKYDWRRDPDEAGDDPWPVAWAYVRGWVPADWRSDIPDPPPAPADDTGGGG